MKQYVGLDVSMEETTIYVLDEEGGRVWRGKCRSEPGTIAATVHKRAPGRRSFLPGSSLDGGSLTTPSALPKPGTEWVGLAEGALPIRGIHGPTRFA